MTSSWALGSSDRHFSPFSNIFWSKQLIVESRKWSTAASITKIIFIFSPHFIIWLFFSINQFFVHKKVTSKFPSCPTWRIRMACFIQPTVQHPKIFTLPSYMMKKSSKVTHLKNWNPQIFDISALKVTDDIVWTKQLIDYLRKWSTD